MIFTKPMNRHGYTADVTGARCMANDFAPLIVDMVEVNGDHFVEWLQQNEVIEILRKCNNLSTDKRFHAKKIRRRVGNGTQQNGYRFWADPV